MAAMGLCVKLKGMGVVVSRFVEEAIFGLSASGSVGLTEIGRALEEKIDLHATHKHHHFQGGTLNNRK